MAVLAAMTVDTSPLAAANAPPPARAAARAARSSAALSNTTTASAHVARRFRVSSELYGCTTTSDASTALGKTEKVCSSCFG